MSEFKVNTITNRDGSYGPQVCGITTFGSSGLTLPSGPTEMRGGRGRGIFAGGNPNPAAGNYGDTMSFITIATKGDAQDFGDLSKGVYSHGSAADATRGVIAGGYVSPGATTSDIEYTTISSLGGGNDFGELAVGFQYGGGCNSPTLAVFGGGWADTVTNIGGDKNSNVLQFITIQTTGNSKEFGDLTQRRQCDQAFSNTTRGCYAGGAYYSAYPSYTGTNVIDFFTFSSLGDAQDFGDLIADGWGKGKAANNTRGIIAGGQGGPSPFPKQDVIQFITIATTGNATDFGDLSAANVYTTALSSSTRVTIGGGGTGSPSTTKVNTIEFITIATTGNATDFGDLTLITDQLSSFSNVNGGLAQ